MELPKWDDISEPAAHSLPPHHMLPSVASRSGYADSARPTAQPQTPGSSGNLRKLQAPPTPSTVSSTETSPSAARVAQLAKMGLTKFSHLLQHPANSSATVHEFRFAGQPTAGYLHKSPAASRARSQPQLPDSASDTSFFSTSTLPLPSGAGLSGVWNRSALPAASRAPTHAADAMQAAWTGAHRACESAQEWVDKCRAALTLKSAPAAGRTPQDTSSEGGSLSEVQVLGMPALSARLQRLERECEQLYSCQQRWYASTIAQCSRKERLAVERAVAEAVEGTAALSTAEQTRLQRRLEAQAVALKREQTEKANLEVQLREWEESVSQAGEAEEALRGELAEAKETASAAGSAEQELRQECERLKGSLARAEGDHQHLAEKLQAARSTISELRAAIAEREKDREKLSTATQAQAAQAEAATESTVQEGREKLRQVRFAAAASLQQCGTAVREVLESVRQHLARLPAFLPAHAAQGMASALEQARTDCDVLHASILVAAHCFRQGQLRDVPRIEVKPATVVPEPANQQPPARDEDTLEHTPASAALLSRAIDASLPEQSSAIATSVRTTRYLRQLEAYLQQAGSTS